MSVSVATADMQDRSGYVGRIPVRNLWLLMLYASDLYRVGGTENVALEDSPDDLPDLAARILSAAVEERLRRHLSSNYRSRHAILSRVRGRIDVLGTESHRLMERGQVACQFDALTIDTLRNRYVRAALVCVAGIVRQADLAHRCRRLANAMSALGVSHGVPTREQMSMERLGRHDAHDRQMIAAAQLAFDLTLPTEAAGQYAMPMPAREAAWARRLFERAVGGFYAVSLSATGWNVRPGVKQSWEIERQTSGIGRILPQMQTDVVLDHPASGRRIVIDTKFTSIVTSGWHREESLRSGYLYQLYAYLRSQVARGDALADHACGLLLHPCIGDGVDESVRIQGHDMRFATVDLTASYAAIRARLLSMTTCGFDQATS